MFGRHNGKGHAETCVRPGGVNGQGLCVYPGVTFGIGDRQTELGSLRPSDPVPLHQLDLLGPFHGVEVVKELLGVSGYPVKPLLHVAVFDRVGRAFAGAVGQDLFIGQHRLAARAPIDRRLAPVGQTGPVQLQEDPLSPFDVTGIVARKAPP